VGIKTGGATGGSAMLMGATTIASGMSDCTLVLGWERMDEVRTWTGDYYIATAACKDFETRLARNYASYYAPMARRFQEVYQVDDRVRAEIAVKSRGYARSSPFSQQPGRHMIGTMRSPSRTCGQPSFSGGLADARQLLGADLRRVDAPRLTDAPCNFHREPSGSGANVGDGRAFTQR
jgi:hypothetical protein